MKLSEARVNILFTLKHLKSFQAAYYWLQDEFGFKLLTNQSLQMRPMFQSVDDIFTLAQDVCVCMSYSG